MVTILTDTNGKIRILDRVYSPSFLLSRIEANTCDNCSIMWKVFPARYFCLMWLSYVIYADIRFENISGLVHLYFIIEIYRTSIIKLWNIFPFSCDYHSISYCFGKYITYTDIHIYICSYKYERMVYFYLNVNAKTSPEANRVVRVDVAK